MSNLKIRPEEMAEDVIYTFDSVDSPGHIEARVLVDGQVFAISMALIHKDARRIAIEMCRNSAFYAKKFGAKEWERMMSEGKVTMKDIKQSVPKKFTLEVIELP